MKQLLISLCLLVQTVASSQQIAAYEKPPVFPGCEPQPISKLKSCFNNKLNQYIFDNFKVPAEVSKDNYTGNINLLFEVDKEGVINLLYVDAIYESLREEAKKVFSGLPKAQAGTYNGQPTYYQYSLSVKIPLVVPTAATKEGVKTKIDLNKSENLNITLSHEYDSLNKSLVPYKDLEYGSQLNIPFTHAYYARFDAALNTLGTNSHTAAKPFMYSDVKPYFNLKLDKDQLLKQTDAWWKRKLWNQHLVQIQGPNYWFTIDPVLDLQGGKDFNASFNTTYNNTRGIFLQGGLGKKFNFSSAVYESQGRFPEYFNQYAIAIKAVDEKGIIPGRGIAKAFKDRGFDYPVAEAYLSFTPIDMINIQFGHGKNFIGDGYRSLLQSDVTSPYPFLKLNTKFWKIKYTNTWMWMKDVRPQATDDKAYLTKYMANHYLSWNVSKRFNLGLFESVVWTNTNQRGFDFNYLNPVIFYRAIEFQTGQGAGNALLGASFKYKWNNNLNVYGQFVLDEFSLDAVKAKNKNWKNKHGYQLGLKYYNAFKVDNLQLQLEYNRVRPYTYSHNTIFLNYGHQNQSVAHLWGANFAEAIFIGRYHYQRWYGEAKFIIGKRGLDFNNDTDNYSYGGDIYRDYNERPYDTQVKVGQGITVNSFHADFIGGYVINPVTNLKLFANLSFRNFNPNATTTETYHHNTTWFNIGLRTDLFNWYYDF